MNSKLSRRSILKTVIGSIGLSLIPTALWAKRPDEAFKLPSVEEGLKALYGSDQAEASEAVKIKAPDIAENGAVVPISVSSDLDGVTGISIYVPANPNPLAASFDIGKNSVADVSTRIKMGKTSDVVAVVHAGGKSYKASKEVKVTIGGCGG
jgi:sulfur-oxidizing protein SoxY